MKLDYATLLSPYPVYIQGIGNVKCPTLKEIWNPYITYKTYHTFICLLLIDAKDYLKHADVENIKKVCGFTDEQIEDLDIFDIISFDADLRSQYLNILNFFLVENVIWDETSLSYCTYIDVDNSPTLIGNINKSTWNDLCDIILQRCKVCRKTKEVEPKFKSKAARRIWLKTHNNDNKQEIDRDLELPNIISAVSAYSNTLNVVNIWDITVYQLHDQFNRIRNNVAFQMSSTTVSVYGNKDGNFDIDAWYASLETI